MSLQPLPDFRTRTVAGCGWPFALFERPATSDGPNAFNDAEGPNSKIGLYKWNWPTDEVNLRVAYYDDVRIFTETAAVPALGPAGLAAAILALGTAGVAWSGVRTRQRKATRRT